MRNITDNGVSDKAQGPVGTVEILRNLEFCLSLSMQ